MHLAVRFFRCIFGTKSKPKDDMTTLDNPIQPTSQPASKWPVAFRWGLIGGLSGIALQLIWQLTGWSDYSNSFSAGNLALMPLSWVIALGAIAMGIKQYRDEHQGGYATFGSAFGTGVMVALVMAILSAIFTVAYLGDIMKDVMTTAMQEQFESQGLDDEQIEQAMKFSSIMMNPFVMGFSALFGGMISGLIFSLIGAAIMKKDPPAGYQN